MDNGTGLTDNRPGWPGRLRTVARRVGIGCGGLVVLLALWMAATPEGRVAWRTLLFIPQVVGSLPVNPQPWVMGTPVKEEVAYPTGSGLGSADLYVPAGDGVHSAVLLVLGVNPAGRDDPRVVGLAEGLARSGAVVMIPWSEDLAANRVRTEEIEALVRAFEFMTGHERVDPDRAGVGGFCVGASLVTVAATDPRIRDDVLFVNFFGGYYSARDLMAAVLTQRRFYNEISEPWTPKQLSRDVVTAHLIEGMSDPQEVSALRRVFIQQDAVLDPVSLSSLSEEAQAVHRLLSGTDLSETRRLLAQLPGPTISTLLSISPELSIHNLKARLLIMHDREDQLVPAYESRRLAEALESRGDVYHTEFSLFQHLDPTRSVGPVEYVVELSKLYRHMYLVIRELR